MAEQPPQRLPDQLRVALEELVAAELVASDGESGQLGQVRSFVRYLKPEFVDGVSESCVLEDD